MKSQPTRARNRSRRALSRVEGMQAVVLAGGRGTRLAPYTSVLPKPLMPLGDRSILEILVEQLEAHGFDRLSLCVGHLSHLIRAVLGEDGGRVAKITFTLEEDALGTAGPLRLVEALDETFLVMNGDVLTELDYAELVSYHRASGNMVTIATHERTIKLDYGVLELAAGAADRVADYHEKPAIQSRVSMGIYVFERAALDYIPDGQYFDFPDLVKALLAAGEQVGAFGYDGLWLDIGNHDDYSKAIAAWEATANGDPAVTMVR
jgi:NDP-mannose synthase